MPPGQASRRACRSSGSVRRPCLRDQSLEGADRRGTEQLDTYKDLQKFYKWL